MNDFIYHNPTKISFGKKSIESLSELVKDYNKIAVVYGGGSIKENGIYDDVIEQLKGKEILELSGIEPNPKVETIKSLIEDNKDFTPDFFLAVGGGSVIDATKLISSAWDYDGDPWDFLKDLSLVSPKYIPFGSVLTLSATGSEMNSGAVISKWSTKEKKVLFNDYIYPVFSILNPEYTFTVPKDQTAYGVIDAFSHVLEQYIHNCENTPLQDRFSEGILLTLIENGDKVVNEPKNYEARANVMLSATMALNNLIGIGVNEDWATHSIEHEFSAFYDIPHAAGLAVITPRWMLEIANKKSEKIKQYGERIFGINPEDDDSIEKTIDATYKFFSSLGIEMEFDKIGVDKENNDEIIKRLLEMGVGEESLSEEELKNIINNCFSK